MLYLTAGHKKAKKIQGTTLMYMRPTNDLRMKQILQDE